MYISYQNVRKKERCVSYLNIETIFLSIRFVARYVLAYKVPVRPCIVSKQASFIFKSKQNYQNVHKALSTMNF